MANDINVFTFIGRATADAELRTTQNGTAVVSFSVAINRKYGELEEVLFLKCTAWKQTAEVIHKYLKKGDRCGGTGKLRMNKWTDKDGKERNDIECVINDINFLSPKKDQPEIFNDSAIPF